MAAKTYLWDRRTHRGTRQPDFGGFQVSSETVLGQSLSPSSAIFAPHARRACNDGSSTRLPGSRLVVGAQRSRLRQAAAAELLSIKESQPGDLVLIEIQAITEVRLGSAGV